MTTAYITHPHCADHNMGDWHPECPERLGAIENRLIASGILDWLQYHHAPLAPREHITRVHDAAYVDEVLNFPPDSPPGFMDPDTVIMGRTSEAALRAAGAVILATDLVLTGKAHNAFCNIRPPGHHALRDQAMGFCFFNNIAIGAAYALAVHGLGRVAICDFDVHHGNGTETLLQNDSRVMLCSSFQHPFYPYTPLNTHNHNIVNAPLHAGCGGAEFRDAITHIWMPALKRFEPQMIFISAGFDAHEADDLAQLRLHNEDFGWVTREIMDVAKHFAHGRVVSALEGGYALEALGQSVEAHIKALMRI
jgi:acetoin utilization deacetylase AcuC-like enzyme